ncbi:MAG: hypothetical protein WBK68_08390, partial [bacterium]
IINSQTMLKFYPFLHHYKLVTVALRWVNFICTWWINSIDYQHETIMLEERPKKSAPKSKPSKKERVYSKPSANHPWRKGFTKKPKLYYEETDSEILEILDELFSSTRAWV